MKNPTLLLRSSLLALAVLSSITHGFSSSSSSSSNSHSPRITSPTTALSATRYSEHQSYAFGKRNGVKAPNPFSTYAEEQQQQQHHHHNDQHQSHHHPQEDDDIMDMREKYEEHQIMVWLLWNIASQQKQQLEEQAIIKEEERFEHLDEQQREKERRLEEQRIKQQQERDEQLRQERLEQAERKRQEQKQREEELQRHREARARASSASSGNSWFQNAQKGSSTGETPTDKNWFQEMKRQADKERASDSSSSISSDQEKDDVSRVKSSFARKNQKKNGVAEPSPSSSAQSNFRQSSSSSAHQQPQHFSPPNQGWQAPSVQDQQQHQQPFNNGWKQPQPSSNGWQQPPSPPQSWQQQPTRPRSAQGYQPPPPRRAEQQLPEEKWSPSRDRKTPKEPKPKWSPLSSSPPPVVPTGHNMPQKNNNAVRPPPRTDKDKIYAIVTSHLSSNNAKDVAEAMELLDLLVMDSSSSSPSSSSTSVHGGADKKKNTGTHDNAKIAFRLGAPLVICKAMSRHVNCMQVQRYGCRTLASISGAALLGGGDDQKEDIVAMGGLEVCVAALDRFPGDAQLQAAGCNLIGDLWWCPHVRQTVAQQGGLAAVVNAMEYHVEDEIVQTSGCRALRTFIENIDNDKSSSILWAQMAADEGAIEVAILAMENHGRSAKLQRDGCFFLYALAMSHDDFRQAIIESRGLTAVVEARRLHEQDERVVNEARRAIRAIDPY